eukprot:1381742-Pleurochrysis_carterae.AAC.1
MLIQKYIQHVGKVGATANVNNLASSVNTAPRRLRWRHDLLKTRPHEPTTPAPSRSSRFAHRYAPKGLRLRCTGSFSRRQTVHLSSRRGIFTASYFAIPTELHIIHYLLLFQLLCCCHNSADLRSHKDQCERSQNPFGALEQDFRLATVGQP